MKRMILSAGGWPVSIPPAGSNVPADDADADAEDEGGNEGNETPRVGAMEYRDRRAPSARREQHTNTGGWGLGAGNEEKEDDDDDDETMNWDQAQVRFRFFTGGGVILMWLTQADVERMIGMKPESPTDMRRRVVG